MRSSFPFSLTATDRVSDFLRKFDATPAANSPENWLIADVIAIQYVNLGRTARSIGRRGISHRYIPDCSYVTCPGNARSSGMQALVSVQDRLVEWLCKEALPLWDQHGVDRDTGGYFESLAYHADTQSFVAEGAQRRGRVVARQIYVFSVGHALGWRSRRSNPVHHGCEYLFLRMHRRDGLFNTAVDASGQSLSPFVLYEHAFYLFALARVRLSFADRYPVDETASGCLQQLRTQWGNAEGGFEESNPPSTPLKSNPHMHLLEAALAWIDVTHGSQQRPWIELARELVKLCLTRFIGHAGAVYEYFDSRWRPIGGEAGRILEPGHQFEWGALLLQWASSGHCEAGDRAVCEAAALRLIDFGERYGVDAPRGVAINELLDDLSAKDRDAKLWPQTERLKAWCTVLSKARSAADADRACEKILASAHGLLRYLTIEPRGLWHELMRADGKFAAQPSKASTFYHIVGAIESLRRTLPVCNINAVYSRPSPVSADTQFLNRDRRTSQPLTGP